ncbi:MAG: NADH-quinone oxidoreductase subunit L, partial [Deltaproteobacteria bacterium]|nr:NADH-quinone oxidoreductase subunit L [Deltaproteobacteria bacterium]
MALSSIAALAATSVPLVLLAVTALAALVRGRAFALARAGTAASFVLAVVTAIFAWAAPPPDRLPAALGFVRTDVVTCSVLLLVTLLGWVVVVFSATYLRADKAAGRYERALLATLVAVTALVVTNHLLVLALAWTTTSLALHVLLTHFRERTQALVAAHKKFLLGRLADVCMFAVVVVLWEATGTFDIDGICRWAALHPDSSTVRATAVLVASAVILKSAQLPFHGWLTQVMEAPTPVSALLHAGIVNIGGFVLVRFAPLVDEAPGARALLVVVGTVSAVFASLVMTTRVSIKVALAWSTCAQM